MQFLGKLLCLLAALAVMEVPYLLSQSYAWITMIHDRAPEMGFEAAVADTFSGEHPCEKCLALEDEREKKNEQAPVAESRHFALLAPSHFTGQTLALYPPLRIRNGFLYSDHRSDLWQADVPCPPPWLG